MDLFCFDRRKIAFTVSLVSFGAGEKADVENGWVCGPTSFLTAISLSFPSLTPKSEANTCGDETKSVYSQLEENFKNSKKCASLFVIFQERFNFIFALYLHSTFISQIFFFMCLLWHLFIPPFRLFLTLIFIRVTSYSFPAYFFNSNFPSLHNSFFFFLILFHAFFFTYLFLVFFFFLLFLPNFCILFLSIFFCFLYFYFRVFLVSLIVLYFSRFSFFVNFIFHSLFSTFFFFR